MRPARAAVLITVLSSAMCHTLAKGYLKHTMSGGNVNHHQSVTKRQRPPISMVFGTLTERNKNPLVRRVCCTQLVLSLGWCRLSTLLVKRQHHGEAVPQRE